jgi:polysaccharide deacetylase 2 family uncharacterized protein YibQ
LLVSSQTMDRQQLSFPKPETAAVEVPGGSEFDQARVETEPVLPTTETVREAEGILTGIIPPPDAGDTPPAFDTSALAVPQPSTEGPSGLAEVPEVAAEIDVPASDDTARVGSAGNVADAPAPALEAPETPVEAPSTETAAPAPGSVPASEEPAASEPVAEATAPATTGTEIAALPADAASEAAPVVGSETAPAVTPGDASPVSPVAPDISEAPSLPGVAVPDAEETSDAPQVAARPDPAAAAEPAQAPADVATAAPDSGPLPGIAEAPANSGVVTVDGGGSQFFTPVETVDNRAENVETNRLPTVSPDAAETGALPVVRRLPGSPLTETPEAPEEQMSDTSDMADGPAILVNSIDFQAGAGDALVSAILIHDGPEPLSAADLSRLPREVTFAVVAGAPNAAGIAAAYRAAGREVVLIPSLPAGAAPQDVEVALSANLESIPQAVALMDVSGGSFQSDREAVSQVVAVVTSTGHGLITFPRGLNTAHQEAGRAGVPTGLIFRVLDEDGETPEQIRRTLDRAAFRARQNDAVILVGHTLPGTLAAITDWQAELGAGVMLAPVSASLAGR